MTPTPIDWRISLARIEKHLAELCLFLRDYLREEPTGEREPEGTTVPEVLTPGGGSQDTEMSLREKKEAIKSLIRERGLSKKAWFILNEIKNVYRLKHLYDAVDKSVYLQTSMEGTSRFDDVWRIEQEGGR